MKIYSNYFDELSLQVGELNTLNFECSEMQRGFRELVELFKANKKSDHPYIIFEGDEKPLTSRNMNLLTIHGGELNYLQSKDYLKLLQSMMVEQFETNPILMKKYQEIEQVMHRMLENLSHSFEGFSIEFEFTELLMEQIWKMLNIHIENSETLKMTTVDFRRLQIECWLKLRNPDFPSLIIYHFPENDVTVSELDELVALLNCSKMTVVCISNSLHFIERTSKAGLKLLKKNGTLYDIQQLALELATLNINTNDLSEEQLVVSLAYLDFIHYTRFLDPSWKSFIDSSRY